MPEITNTSKVTQPEKQAGTQKDYYATASSIAAEQVTALFLLTGIFSRKDHSTIITGKDIIRIKFRKKGTLFYQTA